MSRSRSRGSGEEPDQPAHAIGDVLAAAIQRGMAGGAIEVFRRVRATLIQVCPGYAGGDQWAPQFVAALVAEGRIPESLVTSAIARYQRQVHLAALGERNPIRDLAGYFSVVLGDRLRREGIAWSLDELRTDRKTKRA